MPASSSLLLVAAAAAVAVAHSVLPDHWVPLAVVGRSQRWPVARVARISALASAGHVVASLLLAGVVALVGLRFQGLIAARQGQVIGVVLLLTAAATLLWGRGGGGHDEGPAHEGAPSHGHADLRGSASLHAAHDHHHGEAGAVIPQRWRAQRLAAVAVPFGVAASPDLTVLPIALAATAVGLATAVAVLAVFAAVTVATFVGLTVAATLAGYKVEGAWLEERAVLLVAVTLAAIGVIAFLGA